ncbi:MAG: hypothetical protein EON95_11400 [Caulobacteraceae bacterium]|nr:hypothetical protein [Caulobacter sp.]RYF92725.1 MAG: hypothetical protein EON95_11400 [Caulobacteraceae bacterium]
MTRWIAALLALLLVANGVWMLATPQPWYDTVPGVALTGLFNPHFVRDIGMAYLTVAGGLAWFAWRPVQGWPALVLAATFLALHASIHVVDSACGPGPLQSVLRDLPGVYLPPLIAGAIAFFNRPKGA